MAKGNEVGAVAGLADGGGEVWRVLATCFPEFELF
jgi:hypothetical protein